MISFERMGNHCMKWGIKELNSKLIIMKIKVMKLMFLRIISLTTEVSYDMRWFQVYRQRNWKLMDILWEYYNANKETLWEGIIYPDEVTQVTRYMFQWFSFSVFHKISHIEMHVKVSHSELLV